MSTRPSIIKSSAVIQTAQQENLAKRFSPAGLARAGDGSRTTHNPVSTEGVDSSAKDGGRRVLRPFVLGMVIGLCGIALFNFSTPRPVRAAPPDEPPTPRPNCPYNYVWDPGMNNGQGGCKELRPPPCPAGTIDIQNNGQNDGGADCQPFRHITPPNWCVPTGVDDNGNVACFLPQGLLGWDGSYVQAAMGCLAIDRSPFPRALVNYPLQPSQVGGDTGTAFHLHTGSSVTGNRMAPWIVDPSLLGLSRGQSGWYQPATDVPVPGGDRSDAVRGPGFNGDRGGPLPFDPRAMLQRHGIWTGARQNYDLNNVKMVLVFVRVPEVVQWSFPDNNLSFLNAFGPQAFFRFPRASFPTPINYYIASDGLDLNNQATLPAFELSVQSVWDLWYFASWDNYDVVANEAHFIGRSNVALHLGQYVDNRVWGGGTLSAYVRQPLGGQTPICKQTSYVPVPVIEAQAVLSH